MTIPAVRRRLEAALGRAEAAAAAQEAKAREGG